MNGHKVNKKTFSPLHNIDLFCSFCPAILWLWLAFERLNFLVEVALATERGGELVKVLHNYMILGFFLALPLLLLLVCVYLPLQLVDVFSTWSWVYC